MSPDELLTKKDLEKFKNELFDMLKPVLQTQGLTTQGWLKTKDVLKLLNISSGTLQKLRVSGTLNHHKVGGILYYKREDIEKMPSGPEKKSPKRN